MSEHRVTFQSDGVTIPLSTIVGGSQLGVLQRLNDGLDEAEVDHATIVAKLAEAREEVDRLELALARADSRVVAWRDAHAAAKRAFGL